MSALTPERIAAIRCKNAERPPAEWPDRYLVDELLDVIEAQQAEIERGRRLLKAADAKWGMDGSVDDGALWDIHVETEFINAIEAYAALREAVPDA